MGRAVSWLIVMACCFGSPDAWAAEPVTDHAIVVYGATPAGVAAALAAAEEGQAVLLIEPTAQIGGLLTSGLSHADFRSFPGLTGTFRDFTHRVLKHYRETYGDDSPQVTACFGGTQGEPKVHLQILQQMIAERPSLAVMHSAVLESVQHGTDDREGMAGTQRIESLGVRDQDGQSRQIAGSVFIDGSYEGDLMAAAGVPYHVGREGRDVYGESLAPEQGDDQLQGYNFRLIMTPRAENRVRPLAPPGYDREQFTGVLTILESGQIDSVFGYPSRCIFKAHTPGLPNDKYDINDVSRGLVRLSLPGENRDWPEGDAATRQRIFDEHRLWHEGLLYFLQNDPEVAESFQQPAREWGWCRDEFVDHDHRPPQLYVREARRMIGQYVFTEADTDSHDGDARSALHPNAIAMGDYGPNCHGTDREGTRFQGRHTGEFYKGVAPYQIPYGVLVANLQVDQPGDESSAGRITNLLVPGAVSSSHVGFCALRLEPIWTALGQAAGHAAHLAAAGNIPVQAVDVPELQKRLHAAGAATIYFSDLMPEDPDFRLVQWWGTAGGFHSLHPAGEQYGERGDQIVGQYYEPFPLHEAGLDQPLTVELAQRWQALASKLGIPNEAIPPIDASTTRGQFLRGLPVP